MDNRPIGVFDSGVGGLTVVRQLQAILPQESIVYFGDTGRVPYGTRSEETIRRYAREDCRFLTYRAVKCIIAACGTVSSVAGDVLAAQPVPAFGVVEATAAAAAKATKNKKIGIIGTPATVGSGAFHRALTALDPAIEITAVACPVLVTLVENGWTEPGDAVTEAAVARYLEPIQKAGADTLILGCTHFPLLAPIIQNRLGPAVTLIDSGRETAAACAARLKASDGLAAPEKQTGDCQFFVSDRPNGFEVIARRFLGHPVGNEVKTVSPEDTDHTKKGG